MRTIHVEFALLSLLISLQVGALLGQDQPIEVGVEISESTVRMGFYLKKTFPENS